MLIRRFSSATGILHFALSGRILRLHCSSIVPLDSYSIVSRSLFYVCLVAVGVAALYLPHDHNQLIRPSSRQRTHYINAGSLMCAFRCLSRLIQDYNWKGTLIIFRLQQQLHAEHQCNARSHQNWSIGAVLLMIIVCTSFVCCFIHHTKQHPSLWRVLRLDIALPWEDHLRRAHLPYWTFLSNSSSSFFRFFVSFHCCVPTHYSITLHANVINRVTICYLPWTANEGV